MGSSMFFFISQSSISPLGLFAKPVVNVALGNFAALKSAEAGTAAGSALYEHEPNGRRARVLPIPRAAYWVISSPSARVRPFAYDPSIGIGDFLASRPLSVSRRKTSFFGP